MYDVNMSARGISASSISMVRPSGTLLSMSARPPLSVCPDDRSAQLGVVFCVGTFAFLIDC